MYSKTKVSTYSSVFLAITLTGILLLLDLTSFSQSSNKNAIQSKNKKEYPITGFAHGFKDSTWLYLRYASGKVIDSTLVINEQFHFNSKKLLTVKPTQYILRTKSFSDYKYFWMEQKSVIFSGVKGKFRNSLISGSATQELAEEFQSFTEPLMIEIDSLRRNYGTTDSAMWSKILALEEELKQQSARFIELNNTSILSAHLLGVYCKTWGLTLTKQLYNKLSPKNQKSNYGIAVNRFISLNQSIEVGKLFADFEQTAVDGKKIRLSTLKGNYILLEFWASWCGPCRRENPNLVAIYNKYNNRGFKIFGVSQDVSASAWKKGIADDKLTWPNVSDLKGSDNEAALIYGVYEIPTNFLIDPNGKIIAKNLRGEELVKKLKELFEE
jgi:peroxiredoxin